LILRGYEPFIKEVDVREILQYCGGIIEYVENRKEKIAKITFKSRHKAEAGLKKFKGVLSHKRIKMPMEWEKVDFPDYSKK
jgi:hypothetical protein